jgi:predicted methyltransferase
MRALDVATGCGYIAACMALMVGPTGQVVSVGTHELTHLPYAGVFRVHALMFFAFIFIPCAIILLFQI